MIAPTRKAEYSVAQDKQGTCYVEEVELETQTHTQIAIFPGCEKVVTTPGMFGPELAVRDMAKVRAEIFAAMMDRLVNSGTLDV